ncbi:MAG: hypothetical protein AB2715_05215 [Candidatus Thiodiazotropha sp.]
MHAKSTLDTLDELKEILDLYNPIKFKSSEDSKRLRERIPQLYGAIEKKYREITGDLKVVVEDKGNKNTYPNYFEAGYLSGRTFHSHQGYQELLKVIGRVRNEGGGDPKSESESYLDKLSAVEIVTVIIKRFHKVVRQLRVRYCNRQSIEIEDEYDVQDLFHSLLRLYFDDIRAEEYTPSYAGSASRVDFLLKNEKLVIEIKKTRKGLGVKEVGDQLLIDAQRYQSHPDCERLICFVYDPECRIDNPRGIENDLTKELSGFPVMVYISPDN